MSEGLVLKEPKRKKKTIKQEQSPFPIQFEEGELVIYTAHLTACGCSVKDADEMRALSTMGCFGKGSLSKSGPKFKLDSFESRSTVRKRQWSRREKWLDQLNQLNIIDSYQEKTVILENSIEMIDLEDPTANKIEEITLDSEEEDEVCVLEETMNVSQSEGVEFKEHLILQDSDSDTEDYMKTLKPVVMLKGLPIAEYLMLTFEETFFLMFGLGCLRVVGSDGEQMDIDDAWKSFNAADQLFVPRYVVYHHFRSKGWVVKPGVKFGADFLLYKDGPEFYHASYMVMIESVDSDSLAIIPDKSPRQVTWGNILQTNRLAEVTGKEILSAQVIWPSSLPRDQSPVPLESLGEFRIQELIWRRWKPNQSSQENQSSNELSEDEDSF